MPDILKKPNGDIDWQKFFMAIATSLVVVMEAYMQIMQLEHSNRLEKIDRTIVPREEVQNNYLHRDTIDGNADSLQKQIDILIDEIKQKVEVQE